MVGVEEWGGMTGEGEEYFVEHFGSGLQSVNKKSVQQQTGLQTGCEVSFVP